jgi:hypothetical protein
MERKDMMSNDPLMLMPLLDVLGRWADRIDIHPN